MSDKNLLNEGQIRQFMKLASLEPLASGFVDRLTETTSDADDNLEETRSNIQGGQDLESTNQRSHGRGREAVEEASELSEAPMADTAGTGFRDDDESELHATEDELGDMDSEADREHDEIEDLEAAGDAGDGRMVSVDDFLAALENALEAAMGDEVEIDAEDLGVEDEVEMDVELDAVDDTEDIEDDMALQEEASDDFVKESSTQTDDLVEQITKRVAARILKSALAKKN